MIQTYVYKNVSIINNDVLDDEEIAPRTAVAELDITDDITLSESHLVERVAGELTGESREGRRREMEGQAPLSPIQSQGLQRRELQREKRKKPQEKGKAGNAMKKQKEASVVEEIENEEEQKNSDDFPADVRPDLFKDDRKFNKLSYESAAKICWEYKQMKERKELKEKKSGNFEKADDKLPLLKIEAGEDDARNVFCEARKILRPPVVEMKRIMEWYPTKWEQIV